MSDDRNVALGARIIMHGEGIGIEGSDGRIYLYELGDDGAWHLAGPERTAEFNRWLAARKSEPGNVAVTPIR